MTAKPAKRKITGTKTSVQTTFKLKTWGGNRAGAGRKNRSGTVNHMRRETFSRNSPLHITQRLLRGLSGMRSKIVHELFKRAIAGMQKYGVTVAHYSLQGNHVHLIVEAPNKVALAQAMKSFGCRFGKGVKRRLGFKTARVFNGRYHAVITRSAQQMKNTLKYVLLNQSKHAGLIEHFDQFSSAIYFREWKKLLGRKFRDLIAFQVSETKYSEELPHYLASPKTWLLREGWQRHSA